MPSTKLDDLERLNKRADQYLQKLLENVGKWHLYSDQTKRHGEAIAMLGDEGLIQFRMHYAEMFPLGVWAYELTEQGLDVLEEIAGQEIADEAVEQREFYRKETSKEAWEAKKMLQNVAKEVKNRA